MILFAGKYLGMLGKVFATTFLVIAVLLGALGYIQKALESILYAFIPSETNLLHDSLAVLFLVGFASAKLIKNRKIMEKVSL